QNESKESVGYFFFPSRRRHTRAKRDWSSDVCSSDLRKRPRRRGRNQGETVKNISCHGKTNVKNIQNPVELPPGFPYTGINTAAWAGPPDPRADMARPNGGTTMRRLSIETPDRAQQVVRSEERRVGKESRTRVA